MSEVVPAGSLRPKLEKVAERTKELRTALEQFDESIRHGLLLVDGDLPLVEALAETHAGLARSVLNEALANLETARKDLRTAMAGLAVEQGASQNQLAKAIGVSRQLISQLAKETRLHQEPPEQEPPQAALQRPQPTRPPER
jgi:DNA-binding XRE family transcriptional regulator